MRGIQQQKPNIWKKLEYRESEGRFKEDERLLFVGNML